MITNETPLTEVAAHLPLAAAQLLCSESHETQAATLNVVKGCLIYWQTDNYSLDPITKEGVLNALVVTVVSMLHEHQEGARQMHILHHAVQAQQREIAMLRQLLTVAEDMLGCRVEKAEGDSNG